MPIDIIDSVASFPELHQLKALPPHQLIDLIVRQQQLIQQLLSQTPGEASSLDGLLAKLPSTPPSPEVPQASETPYFMIQPDQGTSYQVALQTGACWTIGREDNNAIILDDQWMSRNHAMMQRMESGEFVIIDLGSRNGTFVNGRRVNIPMVVHHEDLITVGQTNLHFYKHARPLEVTGNLDGLSPHSEEPITGLLHIRHLVSVLVIDIRNFTVLTRQLEGQVLSDFVGHWFRTCGEIIRRHGSWVDKYIGDAVMAVWIHGARDNNIPDIQHPLHALLELQQMTSELHERYQLPHPIQIGAGLNTGYAMVGNTGSGDRPDYTALGDTVNAAFRLENSTKHLGVDFAMGASTHQSLQEGFGNCLPMHATVVQLKGYDAPMQVYAGTFRELAQFLQGSVPPTAKDKSLEFGRSF
jgi:adenylate cyclase